MVNTDNFIFRTPDRNKAHFFLEFTMIFTLFILNLLTLNFMKHQIRYKDDHDE
jgi:hypothetical protein